MSGSAPRMRGTHIYYANKYGFHRFSPAYAGNTNKLIIMRYKYKVQPRVCGEHWVAQLAAYAEAGSAPRMRGTQFGLWESNVSQRFSPAYAGNTMAKCI